MLSSDVSSIFGFSKLSSNSKEAVLRGDGTKSSKIQEHEWNAGKTSSLFSSHCVPRWLTVTYRSDRLTVSVNRKCHGVSGPQCICWDILGRGQTDKCLSLCLSFCPFCNSLCNWSCRVARTKAFLGTYRVTVSEGWGVCGFSFYWRKGRLIFQYINGMCCTDLAHDLTIWMT